MRGYPQWRWHLDEAFVKVNGKLCYLWRAVDQGMSRSVLKFAERALLVESYAASSI
jgi:transposase-like protein